MHAGAHGCKRNARGCTRVHAGARGCTRVHADARGFKRMHAVHANPSGCTRMHGVLMVHVGASGCYARDVNQEGAWRRCLDIAEDPPSMTGNLLIADRHTRLFYAR